MLPLAFAALVQPAAPADKPLVPFPHPLISEVLFAVPTGKEGDADQDGNRSATGDEFIELFNPHDKPINLKGYVLSDASSQSGDDDARKEDPRTNMPYPKEETGKQPGKKEGDKPTNPGGGTTNSPRKESKPTPRKEQSDSRIRFVFPDLTLQPGEVVVVFNGFESRPVGLVGTSSTAAKKNEKFSNAYVLTMNAKNKFVALSNSGDYVLLSDPAGKPVECVHWGDRRPEKEIDPPLDEVAPVSKVSVQRKGPQGTFADHTETDPNRKFSPGVFEAKSR